MDYQPDLVQCTGFAEGGTCPRCHNYRTDEGHDPCIANLPGVRFACCGHGGPGEIAFQNGVTLYFDRATDVTFQPIWPGPIRSRIYYGPDVTKGERPWPEEAERPLSRVDELDIRGREKTPFGLDGADLLMVALMLAIASAVVLLPADFCADVFFVSAVVIALRKRPLYYGLLIAAVGGFEFIQRGDPVGLFVGLAFGYAAVRFAPHTLERCGFCHGIGDTPLQADDPDYRAAWLASDDTPSPDGWKICTCPICKGRGYCGVF
jgi:hypothetical protein